VRAGGAIAASLEVFEVAPRGAVEGRQWGRRLVGRGAGRR